MPARYSHYNFRHKSRRTERLACCNRVQSIACNSFAGRTDIEASGLKIHRWYCCIVTWFCGSGCNANVSRHSLNVSRCNANVSRYSLNVSQCNVNASRYSLNVSRSIANATQCNHAVGLSIASAAHCIRCVSRAAIGVAGKGYVWGMHFSIQQRSYRSDPQWNSSLSKFGNGGYWANLKVLRSAVLFGTIDAMLGVCSVLLPPANQSQLVKKVSRHSLPAG